MPFLILKALHAQTGEPLHIFVEGDPPENVKAMGFQPNKSGQWAINNLKIKSGKVRVTDVLQGLHEERWELVSSFGAGNMGVWTFRHD